MSPPTLSRLDPIALSLSLKCETTGTNGTSRAVCAIVQLLSASLAVPCCILDMDRIHRQEPRARRAAQSVVPLVAVLEVLC